MKGATFKILRTSDEAVETLTTEARPSTPTRVPRIGVVVSTHESLSYTVGYRRGHREEPSTIQEVRNQQDLAADGTERISETRALIERHLPATAHPT
jgi:hypothetical protein